MHFPVIVKSSPRALLSKFVPYTIVWLGLLFTLVLTPKEWEIPKGPVFGILLCILFFLMLKAFFQYLRIKNTTYSIYPNQLQEHSYLFKFLGVQNSTINLAETRQIQAFSNTFLDVLFFNCGGVTLTVSGDLADFQIKNIHNPGAVKVLIEEICFGESTQPGPGRPEAY